MRRGIIGTMPAAVTLDALARYAIARSLFTPTTLPRAIERLGFVQADPIRAPARAQDLTLRQRVSGYRAGDLDRRYARLAIEEDFFVNYGYLPRATHALMHPRRPLTVWPRSRVAQAEAVLAFVRERGVVHPREVDARFDHGKARNWFGGSSNASTQLLDGMHYRGWLRVARREGGVRLYAARETSAPHGEATAAVDAVGSLDRLVDIVVATYAPLPERSLVELVSHLRGGAPQWLGPAERRRQALERARGRLASAVVDGVRWYWPAGENPASARQVRAVDDDRVRLLAPFDPVVWDRRRFEAFWGWAYRFEAYVPAPQRQRGYYALPLLWHGRVIGWGNLAWRAGQLQADLGYVSGRAPRGRGFANALDEELDRIGQFLARERDALPARPSPPAKAARAA